MITLQDLFDDLAYGELSNVALGNSDLETITEKSYPKVVSAINLGLVEIYKRLNLRQGKVKLHQYTGLTTYYLRSEFADTADAMGDETYLEQTDEAPFTDDVIKVRSAVDSAGNKVHINDAKYPADLFTPSFDTIEIAAPSSSLVNADGTTRTSVDVFTLSYQAKYPKIIIKPNFKPSTYKLYIPDVIEEPLLIYVAYKMFRKPVKIAKGEVNPSTTLMIEFENSMKKIELLNLDIDVNDERDRFSANGWV